MLENTFFDRYEIKKIGNELSLHFRSCPVPESNQRHVDFQSTALPTELTGHVVAGIGFEPMTFGL